MSFLDELSLKGITKYYPGVVALNDVSVSFSPGEVHAIVGENGAGKSTLIKVISGAITPDAGCIVLDGQEYTGLNPRLALEKGISVVYQELIQFQLRVFSPHGVHRSLKPSHRIQIQGDKTQITFMCNALSNCL